MKYDNIIEGTFIKRINRFIAEVRINGSIETVHVKNTGRCKELFVEGRKVYLQESSNPKRKTRYSLISIYKNNILINIDSQIPNYVVFESLEKEIFKDFKDAVEIKREKKYKNSRFDIYYKKENGQEGFIEVKGVTLEENGLAMFPDAPTERGTKHVYEMIDAVQNGYEGNIFFLIQMNKIQDFTPNEKMDPKFTKALKEAFNSGVNVLVYDSIVTKDSIQINEKVNLLF